MRLINNRWMRQKKISYKKLKMSSYNKGTSLLRWLNNIISIINTNYIIKCIILKNIDNETKYDMQENN